MGGDHTCYGCTELVGMAHGPNCTRGKPGTLVTEEDTLHLPFGGVIVSGGQLERPDGATEALTYEPFNLPGPISPASKGGEVARRLADLSIGVFGSAHPTEAQRDALTESLIAHAARWVNDEFEIGLREPVVASVSDRELTAIQEGREIVRRFSLADLILLAETLGIDPRDLSIAGAVSAINASAIIERIEQLKAENERLTEGAPDA